MKSPWATPDDPRIAETEAERILGYRLSEDELAYLREEQKREDEESTHWDRIEEEDAGCLGS